MTRRVLTALTYLLLLVLAAATAGPTREALRTSPLLSKVPGWPAEDLSSQSRLHVGGTMPLLHPGFRGGFDAHVTNSAASPTSVRVISIEATVGDASATCKASRLRIVDYAWSPRAKAYTVAPGETVSVPMIASMQEADASASCQGAVFPIVYELTTRQL